MYVNYTWIVEEVDRPRMYDRVYSVGEYLEEWVTRADQGLGFFEIAVVGSEERPEPGISVEDPRILNEPVEDLVQEYVYCNEEAA